MELPKNKPSKLEIGIDIATIPFMIAGAYVVQGMDKLLQETKRFYYGLAGIKYFGIPRGESDSDAFFDETKVYFKI